jgi:gamma-glutamyltranspeptidase/glutathione hydrolase
MKQARPIQYGKTGAVSAAHPLAVEAGIRLLEEGGNACDAMIAAQAVLCVVAPSSCGLGGDMLALISSADGNVKAINGTGCSPADPAFRDVGDDGRAVTVPGIVSAWQLANKQFGSLPLGRCLGRAIELAQQGCQLALDTSRAVHDQAQRLERGGASHWVVAQSAMLGIPAIQPELARLLADIAENGTKAFYGGAIATAIEQAVQRTGGLLSAADLSAHETPLLDSISVHFGNGQVHVQPPMTQGVLLAMSLQGLERCGLAAATSLDHLCVELTEASFQFRDRVSEGAVLLKERLKIDPHVASQLGGPRSYLHTAGVATADQHGMVCSSLVSVFDDFGSCILVPEGGFTLNNRAQGFGSPPNDAAPGRRPVHTLAPALWRTGDHVTALATPGADGQVQTLLQILAMCEFEQMELADAVSALRWRSEDGKTTGRARAQQYCCIAERRSQGLGAGSWQLLLRGRCLRRNC